MNDIVSDVIDEIRPSTWKVWVWDRNDQLVNGRLDPSEVRKIVTTVLAEYDAIIDFRNQDVKVDAAEL